MNFPTATRAREFCPTYARGVFIPLRAIPALVPGGEGGVLRVPKGELSQSIKKVRVDKPVSLARLSTHKRYPRWI